MSDSGRKLINTSVILPAAIALSLISLPSTAALAFDHTQIDPPTQTTPPATGTPATANADSSLVKQPLNPIPTLPTVHFTAATDTASLDGFKINEGDIDLLTMQAAIHNPTHDDDTPLQKSIRAAIIDFLTTRRPDGDPQWQDQLNPIVWIPRTLRGAASWWGELVKIPAAQRPVFSGLPFLWTSDEVKPKPGSLAATGYDKASHLNNDGLVTLFAVGDTASAADMLGRAVTADHDYAVPAYNSGILQMMQYNPVGAVSMFIRATDVTDDPILKDRITNYMNATKALYKVLQQPDGSQRRLYRDSIDSAWAIANAGQYDLALYVAGQGVNHDPSERRSEAPLIIAYCASKKGDKILLDHWLSEALARYQKTDEGYKEILQLVKESRAAPDQ